jgi:hypothetical protein
MEERKSLGSTSSSRNALMALRVDIMERHYTVTRLQTLGEIGPGLVDAQPSPTDPCSLACDAGIAPNPPFC